LTIDGLTARPTNARRWLAAETHGGKGRSDVMSSSSLALTPAHAHAAPIPPPSPDDADLAAAALAFRGARLGLVPFFVLSCLTLGIYNSVWYVRRQRVLDRLAGHPVITAQLAWFVAVSPWVFTLMSFDERLVAVSGWLSLAGFGLDLLFRYRMLLALHAWRKQADRPVAMSVGGWVCLFLFGPLYLQWKINQEADALAEQVA
jgi:hypothetical protein